MGLFYDRKFDCAPGGTLPYVSKFSYASPHSLAFERVRSGSRVLDIGCAGGYMGAYLAEQKQCSVDGIDAFPLVQPGFDAFHLHDLNFGLPPLDYAAYNYVLMLDVIEHLAKPEAFLEQLRTALSMNPATEVMISTANIGFLVTRYQLLLIGQFNYGRRSGILDLTHTRLFTFGSFERAVETGGLRHRRTNRSPGAGYPSPLRAENLRKPSASENQQPLHPAFAGLVFLSDVSSHQTPAHTGVPAQDGTGAIRRAGARPRNGAVLRARPVNNLLMSFKRTILLDSLILVCLTVVLIKPLFRLKYLDNWPSIESTFIAEGRLLSEHLPHPGWQPLWYCGTRTDYIYPPALLYGPALISKLDHVTVAQRFALPASPFSTFWESLPFTGWCA